MVVLGGLVVSYERGTLVDAFGLNGGRVDLAPDDALLLLRALPLAPRDHRHLQLGMFSLLSIQRAASRATCTRGPARGAPLEAPELRL